MRLFLCIFFLLAQNVFASEENKRDKFYNFIDKSEKVLIRLADRYIKPDNEIFFFRGDNSTQNRYLVIDKKSNKYFFDTQTWIKEIKNSFYYKDLRSFRIDRKNNLITIGTEDIYGFPNGYLYFYVTEDLRLIDFHVVENRKNDFGCTNIKKLQQMGFDDCAKLDPYDISISDKDLIPVEKKYLSIFKVINVYSTSLKENINFTDLEGLCDFQKDSNCGIEEPKLYVEEKPKRPELRGEMIGSGTGFFINKDTIVTNEHVVSGCQDIKWNGETLKVLSTSVENDIAFLSTTKLNNNYLKIRSNEILKGEDLIVIGYPFGDELSSDSKVTKGIVSSLKGFGNTEQLIQIDAAIQPGNSGGPVIDYSGNLMGVAVGSADYEYFMKNFGNIPQNTNFAIKKDVLINLLNSRQIEFKTSESNNYLKTSEIFRNSDPSVVLLTCWS